MQTLSLTPNITCGQPAASWSEWAGRGAGAWAGGPSVYTLHYTLARCWSEESPTAGHYNCWSWTINTAHTLLPSVDTSAASWQQCSAVQTPDTPRWSQPRVNHCVHLRSLKYSWWLTEMQTAVDRHGLVNCSSDPNRSWQKFSFHSSYLTDVQLT